MDVLMVAKPRFFVLSAVHLLPSRRHLGAEDPMEPQPIASSTYVSTERSADKSALAHRLMEAHTEWLFG